MRKKQLTINPKIKPKTYPKQTNPNHRRLTPINPRQTKYNIFQAYLQFLTRLQLKLNQKPSL